MNLPHMRKELGWKNNGGLALLIIVQKHNFLFTDLGETGYEKNIFCYSF